MGDSSTENRLILDYQLKQRQSVLAVKWDGSQAAAGMIIEWVEQLGDSARYYETNETLFRLGPQIVITQDGLTVTLIKDGWLVRERIGPVGLFVQWTDEHFHSLYERL